MTGHELDWLDANLPPDEDLEVLPERWLMSDEERDEYEAQHDQDAEREEYEAQHDQAAEIAAA